MAFARACMVDLGGCSAVTAQPQLLCCQWPASLAKRPPLQLSAVTWRGKQVVSLLGFLNIHFSCVSFTSLGAFPLWKSCPYLFTSMVWRWILPAASCWTKAFPACPVLSESLLQLAVPTPVCLWLLRQVLREAASPRQKAAMGGSKRLSMAMSEEGGWSLRVGVCFHSCEGE